MKVWHLNCVTSCPLGGRLMDGRTATPFRRGQLCCHCLLLETDRGLVLVDTGFGLNDVRRPRERLSTFFLAMLSPDIREEMTAAHQLRRLGFQPHDVRHIVLTHLDFDHAGGLDDFPGARVHLMQRERDDAAAQRSWLDRQRYRPQQWASRSRWQAYPAGRGENWLGFENVRALDGLPPELLMVPLPGHTLGHAGVAIRTGGRWLLQTGDAYFHHREMAAEPSCTPGLRFYQWMMEKDRRARLDNQRRLRTVALARDSEITVCCAHDPVEFERLAGRGMNEVPDPGARTAPRRPDLRVAR